MSRILAVVDLQFGSTGKGQIAGTLAHSLKYKPDTVVTAWGPNAGHTFNHKGRKFVHTMLATSALAPSIRDILIGPGSVINLENLAAEINAAADLLVGKNLILHPQAAIVKQHHREAEADLVKIGSTMKGTMEAAYGKMRRFTEYANVVKSMKKEVYDVLSEPILKAGMSLSSLSSHVYDRAIDRAEMLFMEGAQGFSLGIHTDFYPYTTSRDVSTAQMMADCRVPYTRSIDVLGVCRTYPIRVANRYVGSEMIGTSGPCYGDQKEITWENIGREPELTTVTKLPRRIFTFSDIQIQQAARVMGCSHVALTFCDYIDPTDHGTGYGMVGHDVEVLIGRIKKATGRSVSYLSYGPRSEDVFDIMKDRTDNVHVLNGRVLP